MIRTQWVIVVIVSALCGGARGGDAIFPQRGANGLQAWFVLPARMVPDRSELPEGELPKPFELRAARNEHECAQLVVMSGKAIRDVAVEFSDFAGHDGATLSASQFWANKVAQVPGRISTQSAAEIQTWPAELHPPTQATTVPDPLLPDLSFPLDAGLTRIWLTVHIPKDAAPGTYRGDVRLKRGGAVIFALPLVVVVWHHVLPDEPSLMVLANVLPGKSSWEQLQPFYDNLKWHSIRATGEVFPLSPWRPSEPPPDMAQYEKALKYVLDDLGFERFRFPAGAFDGYKWDGIPIFAPPPAAADAIWIDGADFSNSDPPPASSTTTAPTARWTRAGGRARLEHFAGDHPAWVEYTFDNTLSKAGDARLWLWLQVETMHREEWRVIQIDGQPDRAITGEQLVAGDVGFACLPQPVTLSPGRHKIRIVVERVLGSSNPIGAIFLTPDRNPDFERILRERAPLSPEFVKAFGYDARSTADWLRQRGWLKKAQLKMTDDASIAAQGRLAQLYDGVGNVLASIRRELPDAPSPMLRRSVEVWNASLSREDFDADAARRPMQGGQELWASHELLHTLGYPSISMRLIPWLAARQQVDGYTFAAVNYYAQNPWVETGQNGTFMRQTLIYPDPQTARPIDSVRWELFREGLEDHQTLQMLRAAVDEAIGRNERDGARVEVMNDAQRLLEEQVPALIRDARDFTWDPAALEDLRTRAGNALSALTAP